MVKLFMKLRGLIMTGTKEITMNDLMAGINQMNDRLSEIELILNDPLHGLDDLLPDGFTMEAGTMLDADYPATLTDIKTEDL